MGMKQKDAVYALGEEKSRERGWRSMLYWEAFLGRKEHSGPCIMSYHKQRLGFMHYLLPIIPKSVYII